MIPVVMCQRSFLVFDGTLLHPLCLQFTALSLSCELLYGRDRPLFAFLLSLASHFSCPFWHCRVAFAVPTKVSGSDERR
jgi:hypothetical protein